MRHSMLRGLGAAAGVAGFAVAAHAADLPLRSAPPVFTAAPVINLEDWSGIYVGTTYGWGFHSFKDRQGGFSHTVDPDGQTGGALVGYRFQTGHWVFGAEGSIDLNVIRKINKGGGIIPAEDDDLYDIRFRGMAGYEFGRFMPFIAGGGVLTETYHYGTAPAVAGIPNWFGQNKQELGWTVGAGVEYKFNPQEFLPSLPSWIAGPLILRAEYIYDSLPTDTFKYAATTYHTSHDASTIRGAIIYRFGDNPLRVDVTPQGDVNWAGGYGGILGGYGSSTVRTRLLPAGPTNNSIGGDGGLGGIFAGTNFMFGHVMVGIDGSTSYSDFTGHGHLPAPVGVGDLVDYRSYIQADVTGRLGYAFGRFLPFVAGGVAFSRSEQTDAVTGSMRGRVPPDALTAGGGLDYRLSDRFSLRLEYLHEFNSWKNNVQLGTANPAGAPSTFSQERSSDIGRAGIAYHFE